MNTFQIIVMSLAAILVVSTFWDKIFSTFKTATKPKVKPFTPVDDHAAIKSSSLVEIVRCWEHLKTSCEKHKLDQACRELDKIFPLFVPDEIKNEELEVKNV